MSVEIRSDCQRHVGLAGLEPATCRVSGGCSNHSELRALDATSCFPWRSRRPPCTSGHTCLGPSPRHTIKMRRAPRRCRHRRIRTCDLGVFNPALYQTELGGVGSGDWTRTSVRRFQRPAGMPATHSGMSGLALLCYHADHPGLEPGRLGPEPSGLPIILMAIDHLRAQPRDRTEDHLLTEEVLYH